MNTHVMTTRYNHKYDKSRAFGFQLEALGCGLAYFQDPYIVFICSVLYVISCIIYVCTYTCVQIYIYIYMSHCDIPGRYNLTGIGAPIRVARVGRVKGTLRSGHFLALCLNLTGLLNDPLEDGIYVLGLLVI